MGAKGIDSWLSVWSNGLLLENVDENHQQVTRFFPIESLHYCAAVRYVLVPSASPPPPSSPVATEAPDRIARFLPLDSPFARHPNIHHPPLFACIMRRTTGIKVRNASSSSGSILTVLDHQQVLECHVFICKRETAANALVRCCFHAYADSTYAQHLEEEGNVNSAILPPESNVTRRQNLFFSDRGRSQEEVVYFGSSGGQWDRSWANGIPRIAGSGPQQHRESGNVEAIPTAERQEQIGRGRDGRHCCAGERGQHEQPRHGLGIRLHARPGSRLCGRGQRLVHRAQRRRRYEPQDLAAARRHVGFQVEQVAPFCRRSFSTRSGRIRRRSASR